MYYFLLRQDYRVPIYPRIKNQKIVENLWSKKTAQYCETMPYDSTLGYMRLPFIEKPSFILSEELFQLLSAYQMGSKDRCVVLDSPDGISVIYRLYQPPILACVSEKSEYNPDNTLRKLVLNRRKIGAHKVFQVAGILERYFIVDFEMLELMLIEGIYPFLFEKVELEEVQRNERK